MIRSEYIQHTIIVEVSNAKRECVQGQAKVDSLEILSNGQSSIYQAKSSQKE